MQLGTDFVLNPDHLTTHSLCLGTTGSGKTGLGILMLEWAIQAHLPALVLDIKGDLSGLCGLSGPQYTIETYVPESAAETIPEIHQMLLRDHKPCMTIIYLAHLSALDRETLITQILNQFTSWMRLQPGSQELKGLLHIDEIVGLCPPTKNPPPKTALMGLLKQARGFGYGVNLATQNPGDLDYKGLSNIGTWFVGKLTTKRDRSKVMEGMEGNVAEAAMLQLKPRQFLVRSTHTGQGKFKTLDCASQLKGPVTLQGAVQYMDRFTSRYLCRSLGLFSRVGEDLLSFKSEVSFVTKQQHALELQQVRLTKDGQLAKLAKRKAAIKLKIQTEEDRRKQKTFGAFASGALAVAGMFLGSGAMGKLTRAGSAIKQAERAQASQGKLATLEAQLHVLEAEEREVYQGALAQAETVLQTPHLITTHTLWENLRS